ASNRGRLKPVKPANDVTPGISTAHSPQPFCSMCASIALASASLSRADSVAGKYSMTRASAFNRAKGSRSVSIHWRRRSRPVRSSVTCRGQILSKVHHAGGLLETKRAMGEVAHRVVDERIGAEFPASLVDCPAFGCGDQRGPHALPPDGGIDVPPFQIG